MVNLSFAELRQANADRAKDWEQKCPPGQPDYLFRLTELCGELGELADNLKKRRRHELGMPGGRVDDENMIDELGDVQISLDLLARELGVDLAAATMCKFNKTSAKHGMTEHMIT